MNPPGIPKGVLMVLKQLLPALGIAIDPVAVETMWNKMSVAIPDFLTKADQKITSIDARLAAIEKRLDSLEQPMIADDEPKTFKDVLKNVLDREFSNAE